MQPHSKTGSELQNLARAYYNQRQSILKSPEYNTANQKHELTIKQYETYHQRINSLTSIHQKLTTQGISITLPNFPEVHTTWIKEDKRIEGQGSILSTYIMNTMCLQLTENKLYHYQLSLEARGMQELEKSECIFMTLKIKKGISNKQQKEPKLEWLINEEFEIHFEKIYNHYNRKTHFGKEEMRNTRRIDRVLEEKMVEPSASHIKRQLDELLEFTIKSMRTSSIHN